MNELDPSVSQTPSKSRVAILMHGIRDYGNWMEPLKERLGIDGIEVKSFSYGRVGAVYLVLPLWARRSRERGIRVKLSQLISRHDDADVIVFAHSYGSYLFTDTLRENKQLRVARAVFEGSIVSLDFDWDGIAHCFNIKKLSSTVPVLNCCGNGDRWPIYASHLCEDYGESGTRGFMNGRVHDYYFVGDHSRFLSPLFAEEIWMPFVKSEQLPSRSLATPLDHHDAVTRARALRFVWIHLGIRHVFGALFWLRHALGLLLLVAIVALLIYIFVWGRTRKCYDRTDVPIEEFVQRLDESLTSEAAFRVFSENFAGGQCWHVKWRARIKAGSNRQDKTHYILVEPIEPIDGLTKVDMNSLQIFCSFAKGKNWAAFQAGEAVIVEGDVKQVRPKQILLRECSVSIQPSAAAIEPPPGLSASRQVNWNRFSQWAAHHPEIVKGQRWPDLTWASVHEQNFEKGFVVYNITNDWAELFFTTRKEFQTVPTPGVHLTPGDGRQVNENLFQQLTQGLTDAERASYRSLIDARVKAPDFNGVGIIGGIATLYIRHRLYEQFGRPQENEHLVHDVLIGTGDGYRVLLGLRHGLGGAEVRDGLDNKEEAISIYVLYDTGRYDRHVEFPRRE